MYILITGLSLFRLGLEFESCGCFQIFNIKSELFWWGQKNRVSFGKATSFFKGMTKAFSFSFDLSFFFLRTVFYLWFSSQSYSYHSIASCLVQRQRSSFSRIFYCVYVWQFFSRGPLIIFFISCLFRVEKFRFHQHQVVDFMVSHVMIMYLKLWTPKHGAVGLGDLIIRFYYTFFSFCREYHIFLLLKGSNSRLSYIGYIISIYETTRILHHGHYGIYSS